MVLYRVYSQPHLRKYYSTVCSRATLFQLIVYALMVIPPALIAYETNGKLLFQLKRTANWRWVLVYRRTRLQAPTLQTCISVIYAKCRWGRAAGGRGIADACFLAVLREDW